MKKITLAAKILPFVGFLAWILILGFTSLFSPSITKTENAYFVMRLGWTALIFAAFPLASLIFGIIKRKESGACLIMTSSGIILGVLLLFGIWLPIEADSYSTDMDIIETVEKDLGVELPEDLTVVTKDWSGYKKIVNQDLYYKTETVVHINNPDELKKFKAEMDTKKWTDWIWGFYDIIGLTHTVPIYSENSDYEHFERNIFYCYETEKLNQKELDPGNSYIYIAFNYEMGVFYIIECESVDVYFREKMD